MRAALLLCILLCACNSLPGPGRSVGVRVEFGGPMGRGAVVGPSRVLTVAHVVGESLEVWVSTSTRGKRWVLAKVLARYHATPEDVVLLELDVSDGPWGALFGFTGFSDGDAFTIRKGEAARVLTARGLLEWLPGVVEPGDSGSPVVDAAGNLVGLVVGRRATIGVYAKLGAVQ